MQDLMDRADHLIEQQEDDEEFSARCAEERRQALLDCRDLAEVRSCLTIANLCHHIRTHTECTP